MVNNPKTPFCSTIIPTVGRESLSRAVESVLSQELPEGFFEIIVVNDSGQPLAQANWQQSEQVRMIETCQRERSVARNTGAAIAKGSYLHFLDDDDWLAPGALQHFWKISQNNPAKWLYGITQIVDRNHTPSIRLHHGLNGNCFVRFMAGEWIPLQASLIDAQSFFTVGGFNPLITGPEDVDLLRKIGLFGEVAETNNLVAYVVMGEAGSTTNSREQPNARRWAREKILDMPNVFERMRSSSTNSRWKGRITRIYLTSMVWNLRRGRVFTAVSRLLYGFANILSTGPAVLTVDYWRTVFRSYTSEAFQKGFKERMTQEAFSNNDENRSSRNITRLP